MVLDEYMEVEVFVRANVDLQSKIIKSRVRQSRNKNRNRNRNDSELLK